MWRELFLQPLPEWKFYTQNLQILIDSLRYRSGKEAIIQRVVNNACNQNTCTRWILQHRPSIASGFEHLKLLYHTKLYIFWKVYISGWKKSFLYRIKKYSMVLTIQVIMSEWLHDNGILFQRKKFIPAKDLYIKSKHMVFTCFKDMVVIIKKIVSEWKNVKNFLRY